MNHLVVFVAIGIAYVHGGLVKRQDFCPLFCPEIYQPLCASDRKTYSNECFFHRAQCMDPNLTLVAKEACDGSVNRRKREILARIGNLRATGVHIPARGIICTTPWCWPRHEPVCGSDGTTYDNNCELNNAMCDNEDLKMVFEGPCTPVY